MEKAETNCRHCGGAIGESRDHCPACGTPTPAQQEKMAARQRRKFIMAFFVLAAFCLFMILWLPRHIP